VGSMKRKLVVARFPSSARRHAHTTTATHACVTSVSLLRLEVHPKFIMSELDSQCNT
jgi:hypothetical protein